MIFVKRLFAIINRILFVFDLHGISNIKIIKLIYDIYGI